MWHRLLHQVTSTLSATFPTTGNKLQTTLGGQTLWRLLTAWTTSFSGTQNSSICEMLTSNLYITPHLMVTSKCLSVLIMSGKGNVRADEEPKNSMKRKLMALSGKVQVLDKMDRGIRELLWSYTLWQACSNCSLWVECCPNRHKKWEIDFQPFLWHTLDTM